MGCLIEFLMEVIGEAILEIWLWLMTLIIPSHKLSEKAYERTKMWIALYSVILLVALVVGLIMWTINSPDSLISKVGRIIFFVSAILMVAQIILGIISKIIAKRNKIEGEDDF